MRTEFFVNNVYVSGTKGMKTGLKGVEKAN